MKNDNVGLGAIATVGCVSLLLYAGMIIAFIAAVAYAVKWVIF